jgi:hypothetical protein
MFVCGLKFAHCETVRVRQQSCWQHPGGAWNSESCEGRPCIGFRMQHACGGAAETARATGTNTPSSSKTNSALAVRRCMSFKTCLDGPEKNWFQAEKSFRPPLLTRKTFYNYNQKETLHNC